MMHQNNLETQRVEGCAMTEYNPDPAWTVG
jgi:hypothetical protein